MNNAAKRYKKISEILSFIGKATNKLRLYHISSLTFRYKDRLIKSYLLGRYGEFIENYKELNNSIRCSNPKIWICWLQGYELAPLIVQKCIDSIQRCSGNHQVVLLTEENLSEYITVPDYIKDARKQGIISNTHYCDIARVTLLAKYGGMWIDSTYFLTCDIPEEFFSYNIFSAGKQPEPITRKDVCISHYRWSTSFIGTSEINNLLFCFLRDFYFEYGKKDKYFIDYLLFDYIIDIAYEKFKSVKEEIDAIPDNNIKFDWLFHKLNSEYDVVKFNQVKNEGNSCFKTTYRRKWKEITSDGKDTFYKYLITDRL